MGEEELPDEPGSDWAGERPAPLDARERDDVEADLKDLVEMRLLFEPQGAKGVVIACTDCGADHYYAWDLLRESLEHMLDTGEPRMHEPAYAPKEDDYVAWDYARGYVDALADSGLQPDARVDPSACPWCEAVLEPGFAFCPLCGRSLAVLRLYRELVGHGLEEKEVRTLMARAGFEPLS